MQISIRSFWGYWDPDPDFEKNGPDLQHWYKL